MIDPSYRNDFVAITPLSLSITGCAAAALAGRRHKANRPSVDLCRHNTPDRLRAAVLAALSAGHLGNAALRFDRRAASVSSMDAMVQLAKRYVRLGRSM